VTGTKSRDVQERRKRPSKRATQAVAPPKFTPWDSPETLAAVNTAIAKAATDYHFIAACTRDPIAHETARMKEAILRAVTEGDARCLRELAGRATTELARQKGITRVVGFSAARADAFDRFHYSVTQWLQPLWADEQWCAVTGKTARDAIPIEQTARYMVNNARYLPEVAQMVALHCPDLFKLTEVPRQVPDEAVTKIAAALKRKQYMSDVNEAAEEMIVQFLLAVGVPERTARAVWDYRKKRAKRGSDTREHPTD
jgi:hypothetical protein